MHVLCVLELRFHLELVLLLGGSQRRFDGFMMQVMGGSGVLNVGGMEGGSDCRVHDLTQINALMDHRTRGRCAAVEGEFSTFPEATGWTGASRSSTGIDAAKSRAPQQTATAKKESAKMRAVTVMVAEGSNRR